MSEQIKGQLTIQNSSGSGTAVLLNGDALPPKGNVLGVQGKPVLGGKPSRPQPPSFVTGQLDIKDSSGEVVMSLSISEIKFQNKGVVRSGSIGLRSSGSDDNNIELNGNGIITVGGAGLISLSAKDDEKRIELDASQRSLTIHSVTFQGQQLRQIKLDAENGEIANGIMKLMANGEIHILRSMRLEKGRMRIGAEPDGSGDDGGLMLRNSEGKVVIQLDAADGTIHVIDNLKLENGTLRIGAEPGGQGHDGMILLRDASGNETLRMDGAAGDIILLNADCAEDFDVVAADAVEPGSVMVLDDDGRLQLSHSAYDTRVAGIVSGAGSYKPALVLDKQPDAANRLPIALVGKVFCKVDAHYGAIKIGDLLTTSPTAGHAMKVSTPSKAFGAVIGKALRPFDSGVGMIPVLVALQ